MILCARRKKATLKGGSVILLKNYYLGENVEIFWVMALKPFLVLVMIAIFAGAITLVRRYAPPKLRAILLRKLW